MPRPRVFLFATSAVTFVADRGRLVAALSAMSLLSILPAQAVVITFEEPGLTAMANVPLTAVPTASQLADQFLPNHGVSFRSGGGFVAVVDHGAPTVSMPNVIGGATSGGDLDYTQPITIRFFDPVDTTRPGVTDFVRIHADGYPLGSGTVTLQVFAVDDTLLGSVTMPDVAPPPVLTLSATTPGIHRAVVTGSSGTVAFDNLEFHPVQAAAEYATYGVGCPGALGVPAMAANPAGALPFPGTTISVQVSGVPSGLAAMITGFSDTQSGSLTLPLALDPFGLTGCTLFAEVLSTQFLLAVGTTATWSLNLPPGNGLLGVEFYNQMLVLDASANPAGLTMSNAGRARIGL